MCILFLATRAESKPSVLYQKCMDEVELGAFKNLQWAACSAQEIKRQDVILNVEYNKLKSLLSSEQKAALITGQKSWLKFRQDWCRFEEVGLSAPGGDANLNFCILELTIKHIDKLKELQP